MGDSEIKSKLSYPLLACLVAIFIVSVILLLVYNPDLSVESHPNESDGTSTEQADGEQLSKDGASENRGLFENANSSSGDNEASGQEARQEVAESSEPDEAGATQPDKPKKADPLGDKAFDKLRDRIEDIT